MYDKPDAETEADREEPYGVDDAALVFVVKVDVVVGHGVAGVHTRARRGREAAAVAASADAAAQAVRKATPRTIAFVDAIVARLLSLAWPRCCLLFVPGSGSR